MRQFVRLFVGGLFLLLIAVGWFWWNRPQSVDMAAYVPADSLVYLESNSLTDVARTMAETDAGRSLGPSLGMKSNRWQDRWPTFLARWTGIGPAESVIVARSQVAFVMLNDLTATGKGDALEFKPLAALVVETHTSASRIKPVLERMAGDLARRQYGQPTLEHVKSDDNELLEWIAPGGERRIVATIDGTAAIIGNDEHAVSECLAARRGQRPSLLNQPELQQMRLRLGASGALAFGYVSSASTARLFPVAISLIFGKLPDELQIQKLLAVGAAKVLDGVAWSAQPFAGGIEDRYLFSLKPAVIARLRAAFKSPARQHQTWELLPANTHSLTSYNFQDPAAAWDSLNAAVSSEVDALSAVFFASAFKASLGPYGIDQPEVFLRVIKPEVLTVRLESGSERPVVIATVGDEKVLRQLVTSHLGPNSRTEQVGDGQLLVSADERSAAAFVDHHLVMGSTADVRRCLLARAQKGAIISSPSNLKALTSYVDMVAPANVVTYTNDGERVRGLLLGLAAIRARETASVSPDAARVINNLPYAVTETRLGPFGFERRTRSPLGQFSSVFSFLTPEQPPQKAN
jgi:hypothetical protein